MLALDLCERFFRASVVHFVSIGTRWNFQVHIHSTLHNNNSAIGDLLIQLECWDVSTSQEESLETRIYLEMNTLNFSRPRNIHCR